MIWSKRIRKPLTEPVPYFGPAADEAINHLTPRAQQVLALAKSRRC